MRRKLLVGVIAISFLLTGCTLGTNFRKPDPATLAVGKSTEADARRIMGEPFVELDAVVNNEKAQILIYMYASGLGLVDHSGGFPQRVLTLYFAEGVMVGQEFASSFADDSSEFDTTKIAAVHIGKSTRAEVIALLGRPGGEVRYPIIKNKADRGIIYSYTVNAAKHRITPSKRTWMTVSFDANDIVSDVNFNASEVK